MDTIPIGIIVVDSEGQISYVNRKSEQVLGLTREEITRRTYNAPQWRLIDEEGNPFPEEKLPFRRVMETGKPVEDIRYAVERPDGRWVFVSVNGTPLWDSSGKLSGVVFTLEDITGRKQMEEALRRSRDELERGIRERTAELEKANGTLQAEIEERKRAEEALARQAKELARSNAELEQFAYVASHDLQEPLRTVASYIQLLARRYQGKLDTDANEFIAFAVDAVTRMQQMINDLLAYSRVGTRGKALKPTPCETVLAQAMANLQMAIEESGAQVTHDPLPTVMADAAQLVQLFQNLIGNALRFHGEAPPRVHISAQRQGKEWVFSVRDNGIGIDPQHAGRIFLIFQRLHTRRKYPGSGIGLAICKKIVERHGGRIWVESQPGQGSTFYFTLYPGEETTDNE